MPKLGRRNEVSDVILPDKITTTNAPFGTDDSPTVRVRIIGGKPVTVVEDGKLKSPRDVPPLDTQRAKPDTSEQVSPRRKSPKQGHRPDVSPRLAPLTEKPNEFDPTPFVKRHKPLYGYYTSAQQDMHNSHIHRPGAAKSPNALNPHSVVPPIPLGRPSQQDDRADRLAYTSENRTHQVSNSTDTEDLVRHLPRDRYLPAQSVTFSKNEELELRKRVKEDLRNFDVKRLKDIYVELTGFDRHLTGDVTFQDLSFALLKGQVNLSTTNLRLLAAMYISTNDPDKVNYEKILAFLSASIRYNEEQQAPPPVPQQSHTRPNEDVLSNSGSGGFYNPITHQEEDFRGTHFSVPLSKRFPYQDRDNAKLFRLIEQAVLNSGEDLQMERIWGEFRQADRLHRGKLSAEQIKQLSRACRIPLQESIINQILDRCDVSNGQYDWQHFLDFIGRVQPANTGLEIPPSKQPKEYVKHYPTPSSNWPREDPKVEPPQQQVEQRDVESFDRSPPLRSELPKQSQPVDPNDHLPLRHPRTEHLQQLSEKLERQKMIDNMERELQRMEYQYEETRKKLIEEEKHAKSETEPWFDRFKKMANALYSNDTDSSGSLSYEEARWITSEYNNVYNLRIPDSVMQSAIKNAMTGDQVALDPLVRTLGMQGL